MGLIDTGLRTRLTHAQALVPLTQPHSRACSLSSPQARTDEHAALIFHLRRDAADTVETRAATNLLAERLHGCEDNVARRATTDDLQACTNELRSSLLSKVNPVRLPPSLPSHWFPSAEEEDCKGGVRQPGEVVDLG